MLAEPERVAVEGDAERGARCAAGGLEALLGHARGGDGDARAERAGESLQSD